MTKKPESPTEQFPTEIRGPSPLDGLVPGRIVHYYPHEHEARNVGDPGAPCQGPWAAIVTMIGHHSWPETHGLVNLNVQMPMVAPVGVDPVMRFEKVPYSETPAPGCWSWMFPGQAERHSPKP